MVSEWATFTEEHAMSTTSYDFAVRQAGGTPGMNKLPSWTSTTNSSGLTAPQLDLNAILKNIGSSAGGLAKFNLDQVPGATQASLASTLLAGKSLDGATSDSFYSALNKVLPTWNSDIIGTAECRTDLARHEDGWREHVRKRCVSAGEFPTVECSATEAEAD
jgi:hypothetical protein